MVGRQDSGGDETPMPKLRELTVLQVGSLFGPLVLLLVMGVAIRYAYPSDWWFHEVIHLVGDAFAVAGVLGLVADLFVTSRLIDHTAKALSERLIGWGLPAELQGEIRKIVDTTIVRYNSLKQYRLTEQSNGKLLVEVTYSYEVRNYGDAPEEYSPRMAEEEFYQPVITYLEYGLVGLAGHSFHEDDLRAHLRIRPADRVHEVFPPEKVILRPFRSHPDSVCRVVWRYRLTMPDNYTDLTSFGGSAIGARVQIESLPPGFEFVGDGRDAIRSGDTWTYTRPFLQHQHIRVRWFRKSYA